MAGTKIRGITLEFDADMSKFSKELKSSDSAIKNTQSSLKDVNKLLKFSPDSTVLLTQKQGFLADAINETNDKLKILNQMQEAMDASGVDKGSAQYLALQREIVETESKMTHFKQESKDLGKVIDDAAKKSKKSVSATAQALSSGFSVAGKVISEAGKKVSEVGDKITDAGKNILPVSTAVGAVGAAFIKFADDSQSAANQFVAATGAASEETEKFKNIIEAVYQNNYGDGFSDIAEAVLNVKQNIENIDDSELQEATESAIALRDTFGYDFAESTRAANTLMENFSVTAGEAFNLVVQGAQNGLDYSGELIDNINEYSVQFQKLGLDAEDMFSIFASGAENGAFNLDKIGDAVKELSIRVVDGSDTTREGFELLGLNADEMSAKFAQGGESAKAAFEQVIEGLGNMEDPLDQNTAGVDLFGTMWEDLGPEVVTSLSTINESIDQTNESMDTLKEQKYDDLKSQFSELGRTFTTEVAIPLGEQLIPVISDVIEWLSGLVQAFSELDPTIQNIILIIGVVITVIGPLITIIGTVVSAIGSVISFIGTLFGGISSLITIIGSVVSVLGGPLTAAIAAIIAIGVALIANWETVKQVAMDVWNAVKEFAVNCWNGIVGVWNGLVGWFSGIWNSAKEFASNAWNGIKQFASDAWNNIKGVWDGVTGFFSGIWDGIKESASKTWDGIKETFSGAIDKIKGLFNFQFKWPHIPLPHFSISGSINPLDWLSQGVPKISVSWYAKAKDTPYFFDSPSIIGVGDVPEVVVGRDKFEEMTGGGTTVNNNITIYQRPGESSEDLANRVERKIQFRADREDKVWA